MACLRTHNTRAKRAEHRRVSIELWKRDRTPTLKVIKRGGMLIIKNLGDPGSAPAISKDEPLPES